MSDSITITRRDARRIAELLSYLGDMLETERDLRCDEKPDEYSDEERAEIEADLASARGFAASFKSQTK